MRYSKCWGRGIVLAAVMLLAAITAPAGTATIGGYTWSYAVSGGKAMITGVSPATGAIKIPSSVDSYPVTRIGMCAFFDCSGLTSVTIPEGVTSIGDYAFSGCGGLASVTIPASVTSIGDEAFYECSTLPSVTIPDGVTSIGKCAFEDCSSLTSVTIPDSMTSIGYGAFCFCCALERVTIPDSVTSIGDQAFVGCCRLTNVTIPASVTSIGDYAFYAYDCSDDCSDECSGLTSVTIPDSVKSIGDYAFYKCRLKSVMIPDSVKSIGDYAFVSCIEPESETTIGDYTWYYTVSGKKAMITGVSPETGAIKIPSSVDSYPVTRIEPNAFEECTNLTSVTIGNGVTSIEWNAFSGCTNLTSVTIPDSVTRIGDSAFGGCSGLTSVTISGSVTSIGYAAFDGCTGLKSVTIPDSVTSIGYRAFMDCSELTSVTIGKGVTSIGNSAFVSCTNLTSVTIPDSVTSIGSGAFKDCRQLTSITIPNSVTNIEYEAFIGCSGLKKVYVPIALKGMVDERFVFSDCSSELEIEYYGNSHESVLPEMIGPLVPGERVSREFAALVGYAAKKLPAGLKLDKKTGTISGSPTKPTGDDGVTVTFTKKGAPTLTTKIVVGPIPTVKVTLAGDVERCKVSGANKAYLPGKKVSLSATAPKGTAFVGWFKDGAPWPNAAESGKAKQSFAMTAESLELVAKFEKEQMSLACPGLSSGSFLVGVAGSGDGIPLEISTQSGIKTVKATKLPAGMKLVYDKTTGEWKITGAPTKAGQYKVVLTVTAVLGATETLVIPVEVQALPSWAVGTFTGLVRQVDCDASGNVVRDGEGLHDWYDVEVTVTVASKGKISGKMVLPDGGGTFRFTVPAYTGCADGCYYVSDADITDRKFGKMRLSLEVRERTIDGVASAGDMAVSARELEPKTAYAGFFATDDERPLRKSVWKEKKMPLPPSVNKQSVSFEIDDRVYTLVFGKNGAVTDTLALQENPKKALQKGKPIFSVVNYVDGVWQCELFGSVVIDTPEGGTSRIQCRVDIEDSGELSCSLVE